jgi:hypothetical protein
MYSRLAGMILHGSLNPMDEVLGRAKAKCAEAGTLGDDRRNSGRTVGYSEVMAQVPITPLPSKWIQVSGKPTDQASGSQPLNTIAFLADKIGSTCWSQPWGTNQLRDARRSADSLNALGRYSDHAEIRGAQPARRYRGSSPL